MYDYQIDWKKPDYTVVYMERARRLAEIRKDPSLVHALKEFYRTHPAEFINDWGMTSDPRNAERGLPVVVPFVLFPKQVEFINWLYDRWKNREHGLCEKSRDAGASWLCMGFADWMTIFYDGVVVGVGSRKKEYVDQVGDPKSLLWKARKFIELLPVEFQPKGYDEKKHAPSMRILNPENESAIVGEIGDEIGRGARYAIYFKDEAAFLEHPQLAESALSQSTNCAIDISSVNGVGNAFYDKRFSGRVPVFIMDWRDDPRKDEAWYKRQCEMFHPVVVAQEIDRNYSAAVDNTFIPIERVNDAMITDPAGIEAVGGWVVGVDAGYSESGDESVICMRKGRCVLPLVCHRGLDGKQLADAIVYEVDRLDGYVAGIVIELDGPGVSAYDHLKYGKYGEITYGVHTGKRLKDGRHYNLRAKLWANTKIWFDTPPVHVPLDSTLKTQMSSMTCDFKDGMLLMCDKKTYKSHFGYSPDRADALVLTHYEVKGMYRDAGRQPRVNLGYANRKRR